MRVGNTLKEFIQLNYNQDELFSKYMGVSISDISSCVLDRAYKINNPLRIDKSPSLGFYYDKQNKLRCWDYAVPFFRFDIFDLVGYLLGHDSRSANGFVAICNAIIEGTTFKVNKKEILKSGSTGVYKTIIPVFRNWYEIDHQYWNEQGISVAHLTNRNVSPISHAFVNSKAVYTSGNLYKYAYYIGSHKQVALYKLYGIGEQVRFITNNKFKIEAPNELYPAHTLIITKARKDKFAIECNILDGYIEKFIVTNKPLSHSKYCISNLGGESNKLSKTFVKTLRRNYKRIILNVDFDITGITTGLYHSLLYGIDVVYIGNQAEGINSSDIAQIAKYITNHTTVETSEYDVESFIDTHIDDYTSKDISDYIKANGKDKGKQLIERLFNEI